MNAQDTHDILNAADDETLNLSMPFRFETYRSCGLSQKGADAVNAGEVELDDVYKLRPEDSDLMSYSYGWRWWMGGMPGVNRSSTGKSYRTEAAAMRDAHKSARLFAKSMREDYS